MLGVFVAAVATMAFGALWYSKILFGDMWMRLMHGDGAQMPEFSSRSAMLHYAAAFVLEIVTAYALAYLFVLTRGETISQMAALVFWAWLGFMLPVLAASILWDNKPKKLFFLNSLHRLIALLIAGIVLTFFI